MAAHRSRPAATFAPAPNSPHRRRTIPIEPDENVVAVFSAAVRKGRWRVGRRIARVHKAVTSEAWR